MSETTVFVDDKNVFHEVKNNTGVGEDELLRRIGDLINVEKRISLLEEENKKKDEVIAELQQKNKEINQYIGRIRQRASLAN